jgi:hypothetical protein
MQQMLEPNDQFTGLEYFKEILAHLALQGWDDIELANVFNLLSATDTW